MNYMSKRNIISYGLIIVAIILGLLLSMLNLNDLQDFVVAKWTISGILSVFVLVISNAEMLFLGRKGRSKSLFMQVTEIVAIPLLVMVLAAIGLIVFGREDLAEQFFLRSPHSPISLLFFASVVGHFLHSYMASDTRK